MNSEEWMNKKEGDWIPDDNFEPPFYLWASCYKCIRLWVVCFISLRKKHVFWTNTFIPIFLQPCSIPWDRELGGLLRRSVFLQFGCLFLLRTAGSRGTQAMSVAPRDVLYLKAQVIVTKYPPLKWLHQWKPIRNSLQTSLLRLFKSSYSPVSSS